MKTEHIHMAWQDYPAVIVHVHTNYFSSIPRYTTHTVNDSI